MKEDNMPTNTFSESELNEMSPKLRDYIRKVPIKKEMVRKIIEVAMSEYEFSLDDLDDLQSLLILAIDEKRPDEYWERLFSGEIKSREQIKGRQIMNDLCRVPNWRKKLLGYKPCGDSWV